MKLLKAVESFERSLVINEGMPTRYECDNLRVAAREAATELAVRNAEREQTAADLAALREALRAFLSIQSELECFVDKDTAEAYSALCSQSVAALARVEGGKA